MTLKCINLKIFLELEIFRTRKTVKTGFICILTEYSANIFAY